MSSTLDNGQPALIPAGVMSQTLSLGQVISILRAYRRIIVIAAIGAAIFGGIVSKILPKTFIATALVQVQPSTRDAESGGQLPSEALLGYVSTQVDLIGSPAVLMKAIDRLGWAEKTEYTDGVPKSAPGGPRPWLMEERLAKNLKVTSGSKDSRLISVSYGGRSAEEAANAANAVANAYLETLTQSFAGPDEDRAKTYSAQLEQLRKNVDDAQNKLTAFRERTGVIDIEQKGSLDVEQERLLDLERRVVAAEAEEQLATLRAKQSARNASADVNVLTSSSVQALKAAQANLEQRLAQISGTLGPRHPEYRAVQSELESVRSRLGRETGIYAESLRAQADTSSGDAAGLRKARDAQRERVLKLRAQQDEGAGLLRAVEAAKLIYDESLKGYDQVVLAQARRGPNATIVAPALPPLRKAKPRTSVNVLIGLLGGFLCAALGSLIWESLHRRVRSAADLTQLFGEPPLSVLGEVQ